MNWVDVPIGVNGRSDDGETSIAAHKEDNGLLQLRVFRLGFFKDGDVGVGVFVAMLCIRCQ
jgi:hypothetical protein